MVFYFCSGRAKNIFQRKKDQNDFYELIHLNRRLYTAAKIHRKTYRLVFKLNPEGARKNIGWKKRGIRKGKSGTQEEGFVLDGHFFKRPKKILSLLSISVIEAAHWEEPKSQGLAYIYYYPEGLARATAIQIFRPDNQGKWTLYLDPVHKELHLLKKEKTLCRDQRRLNFEIFC